MKNLLLAIMAAISLTAQAQTTVPVIWPFSMAGNHAQMFREFIQEANSQQKKYQFVLESRQGAGGAVATQHLLSNTSPAVLIHTPSFFIRPLMTPEGAYDINAVQLINVFCDDQPFAIRAKNFSTIQDLEKKANITIGINPGSITQLVAQAFARGRPNLQFTEVAFKGTVESTVSMMGDHTDLSVDFLTNIPDPRIQVLGVTGNQNIGPHRTFRSQGVPGMDRLTVDYFIVINRAMDPVAAREIAAILGRATQSPRVQESCQKDHGRPVAITGDAAARHFAERRDFWAAQVRQVQKR